MSGASLKEVLKSWSRPDLLVGCRDIAIGDEFELAPGEIASLHTAKVEARRASAAARIVARELIAQLGTQDVVLPRSGAGPVVWPAGFVGSLAHDQKWAIAAVGRSSHYAGIGIDIEANTPLDADTLNLVMTDNEKRLLGTDAQIGKLLFVVKEAVYKAAFPLDGAFLEYHDIDVDLTAQRAHARHRLFHIQTCVSSHLVALATA
jgi:4'-phosphopantetheinyl transferase EntD